MVKSVKVKITNSSYRYVKSSAGTQGKTPKKK